MRDRDPQFLQNFSGPNYFLGQGRGMPGQMSLPAEMEGVEQGGTEETGGDRFTETDDDDL